MNQRRKIISNSSTVLSDSITSIELRTTNEDMDNGQEAERGLRVNWR